MTPSLAALEATARLLAGHAARALDELDVALRADGFALPPDLADAREAMRAARSRTEPQMLADCDDVLDGGDMVRLFTYEQVARRLGMSKRKVEELVAAGAIPVVRIDRLARVRPADLEAYIESLTPGRAA